MLQHITAAERTARITVAGREYDFTIDMSTKVNGEKKSLFTCQEFEKEWEIPMLYGFYHYNGSLLA